MKRVKLIMKTQTEDTRVQKREKNNRIRINTHERVQVARICL